MDERVGVVDGRDDLEAVSREQAHHPVAQQREVLGDHDPHGSSARTTVGPPAGLVDGERPVERLDAAAQAGEARRRRGRRRRARRRRPATSSTSARRADVDRDAVARRVLGGVRERLGDDEVRGGLDRRRRAARRARPATVDRQRAAVGERRERRARARGRRAPAGGCRARGRAAPASASPTPTRASVTSCCAPSGSAASFCSARPRLMPSATSRACAPSCRSRSIRRSSASCVVDGAGARLLEHVDALARARAVARGRSRRARARRAAIAAASSRPHRPEVAAAGHAPRSPSRRARAPPSTPAWIAKPRVTIGPRRSPGRSSTSSTQPWIASDERERQHHPLGPEVAAAGERPDQRHDRRDRTARRRRRTRAPCAAPRARPAGVAARGAPARAARTSRPEAAPSGPIRCTPTRQRDDPGREEQQRPRERVGMPRADLACDQRYQIGYVDRLQRAADQRDDPDRDARSRRPCGSRGTPAASRTTASTSTALPLPQNQRPPDEIRRLDVDAEQAPRQRGVAAGEQPGRAAEADEHGDDERRDREHDRRRPAGDEERRARPRPRAPP